MDAYRGKIAEQIVAQELLAYETRVSAQRAFWVREKKGSDAEVDFIITSSFLPFGKRFGRLLQSPDAFFGCQFCVAFFDEQVTAVILRA